jgi:RNA polymerase sigma-70 factor (ECF subfamily)
VEGRPLEDAELVDKARRGDSASYAELVRKYQDVAVRTAYFIAGSEAEDAAQEAFVKAYYALGRFRPGAAFRPWLLRIVANEARNRRRRSRRRAELEVVREQAEDRASGGAAASVEDAVLDSERERTLVAALNRLDEKDRLLIASRYFLELSEAEMAEMMKAPKGTIKSRLHRSMQKLRILLDEESKGGGYV